MKRFGGENQGVSPVIGVVLMVAITVAIAAVVAIGVTSYGEDQTGDTTDVKVSFEPSSVGLVLKVEQIGSEAEVQLNGDKVVTVSPDSAGKEVLLPTSPGDKVTLVTGNKEQSLLASETVDERSEIGDFILHYRFEEGSNSNELEDVSGNGNDGTLKGNPQWTGNALDFDGSDDWVDTDGVTAPKGTVDEFTIAVSYKPDSISGTDQLIEHAHPTKNYEWFLETNQGGISDSSKYKMDYAVDFPKETLTSSKKYDTADEKVVVGTYHGKDYEIYINGDFDKEGDKKRDIRMGNLVIAADGPNAGSQYFDGKIYEIRLYYTAFNSNEIQAITNAMQAE